MRQTLGEALAGFEAALGCFRDALAADAVLCEAVFGNTADWLALLTYKLVPHLAGQGCLVVAVTGGTNTGKSTVFNLLLGQPLSPVVTTAAATRHPLLAGSLLRAAQCLDARLVPEFAPHPFTDPEAVMTNGVSPDALFVSRVEALPDWLVFLDTPDVDSIDKQNWEVAENIRAAGDVLIAVVTAEKYKDARVVEFFRSARASGRMVLPLMNKADPADDFAVARAQLAEFRADAGLVDAVCFVLPHDFALPEEPTRPIPSLDGATDLRTYLDSLDVPAIKQRVYHDTVVHVADRAVAFLRTCDEAAASLRAVDDEFAARAATYAARYDPAPGAEIGGLFHEFVQAKRGPVLRMIGAASARVARGASALTRTLTKALRKRAQFDSPGQGNLDEEIHERHKRALTEITRDLATSYVESGRNLSEPARHLVQAGVSVLDLDTLVERVGGHTLRSDSISEEFRKHAHQTIETWWNDHAGRRRALEALDAILAVMPAAIATPISIYTAGFGVSEAIAVAGPFVEQFVARVIEYQFGDQMFDLLSPWKAEQQANFEKALRDHLTGACLAELHAVLGPFDGDAMAEMKRWHAQCLKAL